MKYAAEVIGLLDAHRGRDFRMIEIRRYVEASVRCRDKQQRTAIRRGVLRVMESLVDCGAVEVVRGNRAGVYRTKSAT